MNVNGGAREAPLPLAMWRVRNSTKHFGINPAKSRAARDPSAECRNMPGATTLAPGSVRIPAWQRERELMLNRACNRISEIHRAGLPVCGAIRRVARYRFSQRSYRDGRPVRLSESRLTTLFYKWRSAGSAAFALHYRSPQAALPEVTIAAFMAECQRPGISSMSAAWRSLAQRWRAGEEIRGGIEAPQAARRTFPSVHAFYRGISAAKRLAIRQWFQSMARERAARRRLAEVVW